MPRTQIKELPINGPYHANVDENAVVDPYSALLQDIYIDEMRANNPRPGSTVKDQNFGSGACQGSYEWEQKGYFIFVQGGKIYCKKHKDGTPVLVAGATLELNTRVTFAFNGTHLVMANGGKMVWTTDGVTATTMADAEAPVVVTHVAFIDGYIIANFADAVYRSALDNALSWDTTWFFEAESIPDSVDALFVANSKIYAFGPKTLEIWYNAGLSGGTPFARERVIERGILAPYSVIRANNTFYWLNEERRLVFLNGAIVQSVSLPIDRSFADITTVSDAFGMLWRVGGKYFIVFSFPTEDKTWAYDLILDRWYPWGFWNKKQGKYQRVLYSTMTYMQAWGLHLAGSRITDKLYEMSLTSYGDPMTTVGRGGVHVLGGEEVRCENITGWNDYGISNRKKSHRLRLTLKRGAVTLDAADLSHKPKLIVQHRSNGSKIWSNEREVDLGGIGDTNHIVNLNRFGQYRTRQWRFVMSDFAPFILVKAEEFVEIGRD
jgi:hypothetical protein